MANPSRLILEESMIAATLAAIPMGRIDPISMNELSAQFANVSGPTVYFIYGAGDYDGPQCATRHVQDGVWQWSVFCLDRDYRGDKAASGALEVLEAVESALIGCAFDAGGGHMLTVYRFRDQLAQFPDDVRGVCGYELVVYVNNQFRR